MTESRAGPTPPYFVERQWLASVWWVSALVLVVAVLGWQTLLWPPSSTPTWLTWLFWAVTGLGLPIAVLTSRLDVSLSTDELVLHFVPLRRRRVPVAEIVSAEAVTYRPIKQYGGWGIRGWGDDRAYSVRGNRGVRFELADGARVLVGSQRPDELAVAASRLHGLR